MTSHNPALHIVSVVRALVTERFRKFAQLLPKSEGLTNR
jgi:hypothetical protein